MTDQEIIDAAVEKALLAIPEVVGNLMAQHATYNKLNSQFYSDHPELKNKKEVVAAVIEMMDSQNPGIEYSKLLEKALPEIRKRVAMTDNMSVTSISPNLNLNFGNGDL